MSILAVETSSREQSETREIGDTVCPPVQPTWLQLPRPVSTYYAHHATQLASTIDRSFIIHLHNTTPWHHGTYYLLPTPAQPSPQPTYLPNQPTKNTTNKTPRFPRQRDPRAASSLFDSYSGEAQSHSHPASRSPSRVPGGYRQGGYPGGGVGEGYPSSDGAGAGGYRTATPNSK